MYVVLRDIYISVASCTCNYVTCAKKKKKKKKKWIERNNTSAAKGGGHVLSILRSEGHQTHLREAAPSPALSMQRALVFPSSLTE